MSIVYIPGAGKVKIKKEDLPQHATNHIYGGIDEIPSNDFLLRIFKSKGRFWFNNHWLPSGMVNNGVSTNASISWYSNYIAMVLGSGTSNYAYIYKRLTGDTWNKRRHFAIYVGLSTYSSKQTIHLVSGDISDRCSSTNNAVHVGFKVIGTTFEGLVGYKIYGSAGDGSVESELLLLSTTKSGSYCLEYDYIPNVGVNFYINGEYKGSITSNLPPVDASPPVSVNASICGGDIYLYVYEVRIFVEE